MGNTNVKKLQSALENPDQEKEIQNLFNTYDKNKNGKIELFEFEKFSDDVSKFIKADKDGKWGVVSVLSQFSYLDTDKDSSISYDEMKAAILKMKQ
eukprot:gene9477-1682_t